MWNRTEGDAGQRASRGAFLVAAALALFLPATAGATSIIQNWMESDTVAAVGPQFYDYGLATQAQFAADPAFSTGTFASTQVDGTGEYIQLATAGSGPADWWEHRLGGTALLHSGQFRPRARRAPAAPGDRHHRRCDRRTRAARRPDYRALYADNSAQLDLWLEGPMNDTQTVIWVQLDIPNGGQDFCLYYDNSTVTSVSSEAAVFTYTTPRELYFPLNWRYDGSGGNQGTLDIVSFVNGNQVSVDGNTQTLNAGQVGSFTNVTPNSEVLVTGPIAGRGRGQGHDALVPISFAGTQMVFPTNRHRNQFSLIAPYGGIADVTIYNGTVPIWTGNVGGTVVSPVADISNGRSATIVSNNNVPILIYHTATAGHDS